MPRTCSHIHRWTMVSPAQPSPAQPSRADRTQRPWSSPRCTALPGGEISGGLAGTLQVFKLARPWAAAAEGRRVEVRGWIAETSAGCGCSVPAGVHGPAGGHTDPSPVHLRHDLPHAVLGVLFGVDRSTVSRAVRKGASAAGGAGLCRSRQAWSAASHAEWGRGRWRSAGGRGRGCWRLRVRPAALQLPSFPPPSDCRRPCARCDRGVNRRRRRGVSEGRPDRSPV